MNIALIGYRGSGKTTIGKKLASELGMTFVDTDTLITQRAGKTIKDIFQAEGEAGFREREAAVVAEVAAQDNQVIALGGGAVLRNANVEAIRKHCRVIWLQAEAETLYARISADTTTASTRPNLTAAGGLEEVRALLAARMPAYQAAADRTLDVTRLSVADAVGSIVRMV
jgi:shikimate kinase